MTIENISLNLLENGLDFIIRGLDELFNDSEYEERFITPVSQPQKDYKYGIIHLYAGFLLLLKEKLSRDTPNFIYSNIENVEDRLRRGETLNTVNFNEAIKRLKNLDEIENRVNFSDSDMSVIRQVQKYRNDFEHYKIENIDTLKLKKVIIDFIDLINRFINQHLEINITSPSLDLSPKTRIKILSIKPIYERMVEESKREVQALGEEKVKSFKKVRLKVLRDLKKNNEIYFDETGDDYNIFSICPKCDEEKLIFEGEFAGICTNKKCYKYTPLTNCDKCGAITKGYDWEEIWCEYCCDNYTQMIENDRT
jgi:hypothetical protein